jgi:aminopeptidase N
MMLGFTSLKTLAAPRNKTNRIYAKTTTATLTELNYDIKRLNFKINVSDSSTHIVGDVTTAAVVVVDSMNSYAFELDSTITLDSAKFNGVPVVTTRIGDVRYINVSPALPINSYFTPEIYYHGVPAASGGFFNALTHSVSVGYELTYSLSDPYAAKNWWPAKQDVDDKIDTVDMYVKVPAGQIDGSNGVLMGVDSTTTPGYWQYHWQTHYPIDYYLISIAVAKYSEYKTWLHFTDGTGDSMLIDNYFYDTVSFNPLYKANFDSIGQIILFYDSLYGRYPFWKEKYGVCYTTLPGGMEHQTMTTIGVPNSYIIAHELCHQWFGDHVTYSTWGEVWLSEGFATFSEQLFLTHFWGSYAGLVHRANYMTTALGQTCGSVYVTDTGGPSTIFSEPLVYAKGQAVVTMLRYAAPADSLFFKALRTYQYQHGFSNASVANLNSIVDSIYGTNLDTFFNQWIYGQGYPEYQIIWNQVGSTVYVKLIQTPTCPTVTPLFRNYVELELHSATGDTIIKAYNDSLTQLYVFNWAPTMDSVILDPDILTICKLSGPVVRDTNILTTLRIDNPALAGFKVYPNPTNNYWQIDQLPENTELELLNATGQLIWVGKSKKGTTIIPGKQLATGDYTLKIGSGIDSQTVKLTHW